VFSATKVAKAGLAASAALDKILALEKEVSRLRHHVSVLSKRCHVLKKEADGRVESGKEEVEKDDGVASPERVEEPEPQVVAEPPERMIIVAEAEEDVWVASVAKPAVAESRVALEVDGPEVAMVRLPKGKRRRTDEGGEGSEGEESEVESVVEVEREEIIVATSVPSEPRGMQMVGRAPVGPARRGNFGRGMVNPNFPLFFGRSRGFPGDREKWPARRAGGYR